MLVKRARARIKKRKRKEKRERGERIVAGAKAPSRRCSATAKAGGLGTAAKAGAAVDGFKAPLQFVRLSYRGAGDHRGASLVRSSVLAR